MKMNRNDSFTVIYRTGGTKRFSWHRCLPVASHEEAATMRAELERAGYKALIHRTRALDVVGLPEIWEAA